MKYLRRFNESNNYSNQISDILLDLSDNGFQSDTREDRIKLMPYVINDYNPQDSFDNKNNSYFYIDKYNGFYLDEIEDIIYRIKDLVGIENIYKASYSIFNFVYNNIGDQVRLDLKDIDNESIPKDDRKLYSFYMIFYFPA